MGVRTLYCFEELVYDDRLKEAYEMFDTYINFRFDYMCRASISHSPEELNHNADCEYLLEYFHRLPMLIIFIIYYFYIEYV